ncbi:MAG: hypothetical protein U0414_08385 [Polyangiaceae bacterium]
MCHLLVLAALWMAVACGCGGPAHPSHPAPDFSEPTIAQVDWRGAAVRVSMDAIGLRDEVESAFLEARFIVTGNEAEAALLVRVKGGANAESESGSSEGAYWMRLFWPLDVSAEIEGKVVARAHVEFDFRLSSREWETRAEYEKRAELERAALDRYLAHEVVRKIVGALPPRWSRAATSRAQREAT